MAIFSGVLSLSARSLLYLGPGQKLSGNQTDLPVI